MTVENSTVPCARRVDWIIAGFLAAATLVLLTATLDDYGMAWDEGFTVEREERLREWFARVVGDSSAESRAWSPYLSKLERRTDYLRRAGLAAGSPWSHESLRFYWQFAREEPNGHPPFYALLGLAGWSVSHRVLPPLEAYRFGPVVLFALTVGVLYGELARSHGRLAGLMAVLGLLAMPRVFAHAHLASYDVPTLCLWFLAVVAFLRATEPESVGGRAWAWTLVLGLAWGCALATKLTGWFIPAPLAAWALLYRDRRASRVLALGGLLAALVVYALNPTWWADPVGGVAEFLESNLTRHRLLPIPTVFLDRLYMFSLPWYNTLVLTAITVPPLTLALGLLGAGQVMAGRLRDRAGALYLICWVFFLVLRALPNAPGHDGVRLFLAAFVFLACLAGIGLAGLGAWMGHVLGPRRGQILSGLILAVTVAAGAWSTWRYHPLQLSYYNALIGGLSGAARAGMEPTYYWEAVTPDVRDWLNRHTEPGRMIAFSLPAVSFEYLHRWGLLRPSPLAQPANKPRWFVVMNRPGHLRYPKENLGQYLLDHYEPVYVKTLDVAPEVPLIAIFDGKDALEATEILRSSPEGEGPENGASQTDASRPPVAP